MAGSGMGLILGCASARYASGSLYATTCHGDAMAVPVLIKTGRNSRLPTSYINSLLLNQEHTSFSTDKLLFAHSDWAGYSVFEEAFTLGYVAGGAI